MGIILSQFLTSTLHYWDQMIWSEVFGKQTLLGRWICTQFGIRQIAVPSNVSNWTQTILLKYSCRFAYFRIIANILLESEQDRLGSNPYKMFQSHQKDINLQGKGV